MGQPIKHDRAWWQDEAGYIRRIVLAWRFDGAAALESFNRDPACFLRYCDMQYAAAIRDGFPFEAQSIETHAAIVREVQ